ncbi:MAG: hypothetical protein HXY49_02970 [Ignavibacteriaceae bacterium]|nr:hypothetical protein [Ignavibacteriaceae bacterium]
MILETIDIEKNDIIIFSINDLDKEKNFRVIYKTEPEHKIRKITYEMVKRVINTNVPKSMILYRLLTNQPGFEIEENHFGILIKIGADYELMYPDPVYAIKEIESKLKAIDYNSFRFSIQQVGLKSENIDTKHAVYREEYCADLEADEAKNQNDFVFAEAIIEGLRKSKQDLAAKEQIKPASSKISDEIISKEPLQIKPDLSTHTDENKPVDFKSESDFQESLQKKIEVKDFENISLKAGKAEPVKVEIDSIQKNEVKPSIMISVDKRVSDQEKSRRIDLFMVEDKTSQFFPTIKIDVADEKIKKPEGGSIHYIDLSLLKNKIKEIENLKDEDKYFEFYDSTNLGRSGEIKPHSYSSRSSLLNLLRFNKEKFSREKVSKKVLLRFKETS